MSESGFFSHLRQQLGKTRHRLSDKVRDIFSGGSKISDAVFDDLEEILIEADVGVQTTLQIIEDMRAAAREQRFDEPARLIELLKEEMTALLAPGDHLLDLSAPEKPHVTLIAGVNGSGKTTTAGKLAARLTAENRKVILGAADTFRAAAAEQLTIWSERSGADIIRHKEGADPASVAWDTLDAAIARQADNVLIDTAGRLHTRVNLMEELKKIQRVCNKRLPGTPHEVLLVLDATTGQNGLAQARQFTEALTVTGIVLTKLDGTAKGGMIVAIQKELGIPIKLIGVGESVADLHPFDAHEFVAALFDESPA
jgi:fused signal recognition particle receptor